MNADLWTIRCECGTTMTVRAGRGRPPKRCPECTGKPVDRLVATYHWKDRIADAALGADDPWLYAEQGRRSEAP